MEVSIIIVSYNTKELLKNCIASIYEHTKGINFEIIVSDNDSKDDSIQMLNKEFPDVIVIDNKKNLGFGAANNKALDIARGKYIFYLNSDTILLNNAVKYFFDYWEESSDKENIGVLGSNLLDFEGNPNGTASMVFPKLSKELFNTFLTCGSYWLKSILKLLRKDLPRSFIKPDLHTYSGEVAWVSGADLFLKNNEFARFDERYFLFYEEIDLEYRLFLNNKKRIVISQPQIIHLEGGSDRKKNKDIISRADIIEVFSKIMYLKKNRKAGCLYIFVLKLLITLTWINPCLFKYTKSSFKELWGK
ncbi:MAG: glycosyltransferase family 2 protein [Spirochaetaceae bacterium]|nr:glycosyltransferase family 2 protein [Spirochaetaceae bacterium]